MSVQNWLPFCKRCVVNSKEIYSLDKILSHISTWIRSTLCRCEFSAMQRWTTKDGLHVVSESFSWNTWRQSSAEHTNKGKIAFYSSKMQISGPILVGFMSCNLWASCILVRVSLQLISSLIYRLSNLAISNSKSPITML